MSSKKTEAEAARMIYYAFLDISYNLDSSHLVYCYVTREFMDRQLILNNSIAHRITLVNAKNKVIIISFPQYYLDITIGPKLLAGLVDNNYSSTILVILIDNFTKDILTLAPTNQDITNQLLIRVIAIADILDSIFPYQVPVILILFGNHEVK